jgi:hypothetical protein
MTGTDCQQVYQELVLMLNELSLGWVVDQARSQFSEIPIDRTVAIENFEGTSSQAVLTKPGTLTIHETSAQRQLLELIDTIERLVLDTRDMEHELVDFLATVKSPTSATATVSFASEGGLIETVEDSSDRRQAIVELRPLLNRLYQVVSGQTSFKNLNA